MSAFLLAQPVAYRTQISDLLQREAVSMAVLLHLDFAAEPLFLSNRNIVFRDLLWGREWGAGSGLLVGLPRVAGGEDQLAPLHEYRLGMPMDLIDGENWAAELMQMLDDTANYRGRDAALYGQIFDPDSGLAVGHPFAFDVGKMDRMNLKISTAGAIVTLTVESFMARKGVPVYGMQTYFDQKRRHPTDEGLQFVTEAGKLITWTNW